MDAKIEHLQEWLSTIGKDDLALLIATLSVGLSLWSWFSSRRSVRLQRISEASLKAEQLYWDMYYRLKDVRDLEEAIRRHEPPLPGSLLDTLQKFEQRLNEAVERKKSLRRMVSFQALVPFPIPEALVESFHVEIDRISASVTVSRRELLPQLKQTIADIEELKERQDSLERLAGRIK